MPDSYSLPCHTWNSPRRAFWSLFQRLIVERILPRRVAQGPIDVVHVGLPENEIVNAHVLSVETILRIKHIVPLLLPRHVGADVRTSRRHADTQVKTNALLQAVVKNPCRINSPQPSADIYDSQFQFLHSSFPSIEKNCAFML